MGASKIAFAFILFLGLQVMGANQAQANSAKEVCAWRASQNVKAEFSSRTYNILELSGLNYTLWKMLNLFFFENFDNYGLKTPARFEEIQNLFKAPSIFSDDGDKLQLTFFKSVRGGDEFLEIQSFPGGNEFGLIFNLKTGQLVGRSEDTSMLIQTGAGEKWSECPAVMP